MTLLDHRPDTSAAEKRRPESRRPRWTVRSTRRWGDDRPETPPRSLVLALVLAAVSLMTLDKAGTLGPVREVVGDTLAPAESVANAIGSPFSDVSDWLRTNSDLRDRVSDLEQRNAALQGQLATAPYDAQRLASYDRLAKVAGDYAVVPAHVVGYGAAQSFSDTVTLDQGSDAGLAPDLTVINGEGLVGRVVSVTRTTATVLLIVDEQSVAGGRVAPTMDVGFLRGRGDLGSNGRLDLDLVDDHATPARDDAVVTWGSRVGGPYVSGIPVGRVTHVYSSVRETSQRAVIDPFVDFGSLDLVGVIVPRGTPGVLQFGAVTDSETR